MKKISLIILSIFSLGLVFAQNEDTKDYSSYFPEEGRIAIGLDAAQFVRFIGAETFGRINGYGGEEDAVSAFKGHYFGKYFLSSTLAARASLSIALNNRTDRAFVRDDFEYMRDPFANKQVADTYKEKDFGFLLGLGGECRRDFWRVQGYAGAEILLGYGRYVKNFEYGNPIADANTNPTRADGYNGEYYLLEKKYSQFAYGAGIFAGVDYFFNKNISLGFEFALQGLATFTPEQNATVESWKFDKVFTEEKPVKPKTSTFSITPQTFVNLHFYF